MQQQVKDCRTTEWRGFNRTKDGYLSLNGICKKEHKWVDPPKVVWASDVKTRKLIMVENLELPTHGVAGDGEVFQSKGWKYTGDGKLSEEEKQIWKMRNFIWNAEDFWKMFWISDAEVKRAIKKYEQADDVHGKYMCLGFLMDQVTSDIADEEAEGLAKLALEVVGDPEDYIPRRVAKPNIQTVGWIKDGEYKVKRDKKRQEGGSWVDQIGEGGGYKAEAAGDPERQDILDQMTAVEQRVLCHQEQQIAAGDDDSWMVGVFEGVQ